MGRFKWDNFIQLTYFLGKCLGQNVEVVLYDLESDEQSVIAIANGHISGRTVGAPLTKFAYEKLKDSKYKGQRYAVNYEGDSSKGRNIRSSCFFIYNDDGSQVGMMCINSDVTDFVTAAKAMISFCGGFYDISSDENEQPQNVEAFPASVTEMVLQVYKKMSNSDIPISRLEFKERLALIEALRNEGVFLIKGAVKEVSAIMEVSEATLYRYLSKSKKYTKELFNNQFLKIK